MFLLSPEWGVNWWTSWEGLLWSNGLISLQKGQNWVTGPVNSAVQWHQRLPFTLQRHMTHSHSLKDIPRGIFGFPLMSQGTGTTGTTGTTKNTSHQWSPMGTNGHQCIQVSASGFLACTIQGWPKAAWSADSDWVGFDARKAKKTWTYRVLFINPTESEYFPISYYSTPGLMTP